MSLALQLELNWNRSSVYFSTDACWRLILLSSSSFSKIKYSKTPGNWSSSQFASALWGDAKFLIIRVLSDNSKLVYIGFMFLTPWLRIQPKKFSSVSWFTFFVRIYLIPKAFSLFCISKKLSIVIIQSFIVGGTNDVLFLTNLTVFCSFCF